MREFGIVKNVSDSRTSVVIRPHGGCRECASRSACGGGSGREAVIEALNTISARPGDPVEIEVPPSSTLLAACMIFGVPVAGAIGGYGLGMALRRTEVGGVIGALCGTAGGFLLSWGVYKLLVEHRIKRPRIVRLADEEELSRQSETA